MDPNKAYVQVINEKVVADFKINEIIYMMQNPQNDVKSFGYGLSPIESILLEVQSSLNANMYNAQTFQKDNIPPGMLDLGNMSNEEAQAWIAMWNATVINDTQKLKFVWGSDNPKKYVPFQQNNKDMQFVEFIDWLSRLKLSIYGLSTIDANITQDVNRATATIQQQISQSRGVRTIKRLVEEYINREIIRASGIDTFEFRFKQYTALTDKLVQAQIDQIYLMNGVVMPSYVARREGINTFDDPLYDAQDEVTPPDPDEAAATDPNTKPAQANDSKPNNSGSSLRAGIPAPHPPFLVPAGRRF